MRPVNQLRRIFLKLALVLFLLLPGVSARDVKAEGGIRLTTSIYSAAEQYLFTAANREREARGLHPLQEDPVLAQAAAYHAQLMAKYGDISHGFPGEPNLASRAASAGVHFSLISENVAEASDAAQIHDMWMHSEGHRENLLDPNVNVAGIAVVLRDDQLYAVEDFASTVETMSFDQQEATVSSLLAGSGVSIARQSADDALRAARETCAMPTGYVGTPKPWFVMRYTASTLSELPPQLKNRLNTGKYHQAVVGACAYPAGEAFSGYNIAVLLYP